MKISQLLPLIAVITLSASITTLAANRSTEVKPDVKADNSQLNQNDNSPSALTAEKQSNKPADVEITRQIRQGLVGNSNLSTYAKNIKIIAVQGTVNLKGPVRTQAEKAEAERVARAVAGVTAVNNDLAVVE